jgi:hypothetical protein
MLIIRNGRMAFEAYYENDYRTINADLVTGESGPWNYYDVNWHPFYKGSDLHTIQSSTKSFMSALVGIAIARGDLPGVSATLGELLPHRNIHPDHDTRLRMGGGCFLLGSEKRRDQSRVDG